MKSTQLDTIEVNNKLIIDCGNCKDIFRIKPCVFCIISKIEEKSSHNFFEIIISRNKGNLSFTHEENLLLNFLYMFYCKCLKICEKLNDIYCQINYDTCIFYHSLAADRYKNYEFIMECLESDEVNEEDEIFLPNSIKCRKCKKKIDALKNSILGIYKKTDLFHHIINKYNIINLSDKHFSNLFYSLKVLTDRYEHIEDFKYEDLIESYDFEVSTFIAEIYQPEYESERYYKFKIGLDEKIVHQIPVLEKMVFCRIHDLKMEFISDLGEKIIQYQHQIKFLIENFSPNLDVESIFKISLLITIELLKLTNLFPLLVDPFIEEIFLDSQEEFLYINHQKYGRCRTIIKLEPQEIEALKTHLKLESKKRLDEEISSLIYVIKNKFFNCRFSIDLYPSHWKNISIDIRKMNKKILTLFDLMRFHTLDRDIASFLVLCYLFKINITIAGEVNSGKTTLLNAIDFFSPKEFRRIYVEETIETLEDTQRIGHQLKYVVEPETLDENSKEREIYKLLHRSGDIIILGEVLSRLETKALFHCLSAGLKGLQTTHASSINSLLNRWIVHFNIEKTCINDTGIIVLMKKAGNKRLVYSISNLIFDLNCNKIIEQIFFKYNAQGRWDLKEEIYSSILFHELQKIFNIDLKHILSILNQYFSQNLFDDQQIIENFNQVYWKLKKIVPEIGGI